MTTVRLDQKLRSLDISHVHILKIDIEGADFMALRSFDFIALKPQIVIVEFMDSRSIPYFGYSHHDMAEYMRQFGYATFVSEWSPIEEYGRKEDDPEIDGPSFLGCKRYPLDHNPAWGNLIFVPESAMREFTLGLRRYLWRVWRDRRAHEFRSIVKSIPGAKFLYAAVKRRR